MGKNILTTMLQTSKIASSYSSIVQSLERVLFRLSQVILVVLMLFSAADTILRYLFSYPVVGSFEIIKEYLMPYLVFLSISYVYTKGGHVRVTLLIRHFSKNIQNLVMHILNIISIVFFGVLTYASILKTIKAYETNLYSASILAYPLWPAFSVVVLGLGVLTLRLIISTILQENPYINDFVGGDEI